MRGACARQIRRDEVTDDDIQKYHLGACSGDPGSNKLIARLQGKLPLRWTKD